MVIAPIIVSIVMNSFKTALYDTFVNIMLQVPKAMSSLWLQPSAQPL